MLKRCNKTQDAFSNVMDAEHLREIIDDSGWTQKDIARYWEMTPNWITKLISNRNGERSVRDDCSFRGLPANPYKK